MADRIDYNEKGDATTFSGEGAVNVFAMAALASGLRLYAKTGMKPNRAWTPAAMMRTARYHLGDAAKGLKSRDYEKAADLLSLKVQAEKERIETERKFECSTCGSTLTAGDRTIGRCSNGHALPSETWQGK